MRIGNGLIGEFRNLGIEELKDKIYKIK